MNYSRWKYLLLLVIVLVGFIYAAPNVYDQDPTIQVSGSEGEIADASTMSQLIGVLKKHKITYKKAIVDKKNLVVFRFLDTDGSLKAKELFKAVLDSKYTVVVNTAADLPRWLEYLNAKPMNLGLDLRGGVHFLLEVDLDSVAKKRIEGDKSSITSELRSNKLRYTRAKTTDKGIVVSFKDEETRNQAWHKLKSLQRDYTFVKEQQGDAYTVNGTINVKAITDLRQHALEQTMTVLRNRVNELGIAEPIVQQQGRNRIVVDLPGIQDAAQAEQVLGGTATLEFRMVDEEHDSQNATQGQVPFGSRLYRMKDGRPILLKTQIVLSGTSIVSATSNFDQHGQPAVDIRIAGSEVGYFSRTTRANVGKRMGIVYIESKMDTKLVNGEIVRKQRKLEHVISAPVINSALASVFQITGIGDMGEARQLALLLRAGALPANIYPVEQSIVGPSLGKENIAKGVLSVEIGFIIIVFFMMLYYRLFGFIANLALGLNLVMLVAVLSLLGATLTLPGIAGIVLTVGMAVDANVLINERIREELRNGISPTAAIHAGYEKAFSTIVDANVTTLIVAIVLFAVGSGSVKGFAVTLTIGLITSMFTAITGTRAVVNLIYGRRKVERLSIGI